MAKKKTAEESAAEGDEVAGDTKKKPAKKAASKKSKKPAAKKPRGKKKDEPEVATTTISFDPNDPASFGAAASAAADLIADAWDQEVKEYEDAEILAETPAEEMTLETVPVQ